MKIAICCHPTTGGSGVVATELAIALASRGHEIHMACYARPFRLPDPTPIRYHRVNVSQYPLFRYPPHDLCLANELAEVVVKHDIDIIHAHYAVPNAVSAILAREMLCMNDNPVKVISTLHGTDITLVGSQRDFFRVCRYAMRRCDATTAVSNWLRDETMREFDLPDPPAVIPNFVDCDRFGPAGREDFPTDGPLQIMHASNFRPVKRVVDVIRVFERIRRRLPARLLMLGDGPDRPLAEELVAELSLQDDVEFRDPQTDIATAYRRSHLFLLLSDYESFGLSALEAMACGTPVVVSRAGGLVEVVDEGQTGHLCPVGDIEAIADAACSILDDRTTWQYMSEAASRHARAQFCRDKVIPRYEQLYEQVLRKDSPLTTCPPRE